MLPPTLVGTPLLQVWEEHRLLVKQDGGFVAQQICTNNAPKGDCFRALIQICGLYVTTNSSRLRISMKVSSVELTGVTIIVDHGLHIAVCADELPGSTMIAPWQP